jgi:SAM-dependent methyltransferase
MLPSIIHFRDMATILERLRHQRRNVIGQILSRDEQRIKTKWDGEMGGDQCRHWYDIPAVERRCNRMITGDDGQEPYQWVAERFLAGRSGLRGLSLGCGMGGRELRWLETGRFATIEAIDISEERVNVAMRRAGELGLEGRLKARVHDVHRLEYPAESFDVIFAEQALHHFAPVAQVVKNIGRWLRSDGLLIVNEYVGASRFQWTRRQLDAVNGLLAAIPERFTVTARGGRKRRIWRHGRLMVYLHDPSEAVESSEIIPALERVFVAEALRGYGGTLLHPLLKDIAHHFVDEADSEAAHVLRLCFDAEDILLRAGDIKDDFVFGIFRLPGS